MTVVTRRVQSEADRQACFAVRQAVFIDEQGFPQDRDELDRHALHMMAVEDGSVVGTLRVIFNEDGSARVGRVAVRKEQRGFGIGRSLMLALESEPALAQVSRLGLSAQLGATAFYESVGYRRKGEPYMEAGALHRWLEKNIAVPTGGGDAQPD